MRFAATATGGLLATKVGNRMNTDASVPNQDRYSRKWLLRGAIPRSNGWVPITSISTTCTATLKKTTSPKLFRVWVT